MCLDSPLYHYNYASAINSYHIQFLERITKIALSEIKGTVVN